MRSRWFDSPSGSVTWACRCSHAETPQEGLRTASVGPRESHGAQVTGLLRAVKDGACPAGCPPTCRLIATRIMTWTPAPTKRWNGRLGRWKRWLSVPRYSCGGKVRGLARSPARRGATWRQQDQKAERHSIGRTELVRCDRHRSVGTLDHLAASREPWPATVPARRLGAC